MTSRPKLLVRSCPVIVAHSLPAGFDSVRAGVLFTPFFTRSRSDHRSAASTVVVAHSSSVPGRLNRFVRSSSRVKCVGLALFMQA